MSEGKWKLPGLAIVIIAAIAFSIGVRMTHNNQVKEFYREAENLIAQERYREAREILEKIVEEEYRDTLPLIKLCKSHEEYDSGDLEEAWSIICNEGFAYQSAEQIEAIHNYTGGLRQEYRAYIRKVQLEKAQRYRNKIKNGVPYVGMRETEIGNTSLGAPDPVVRHNYETKHGNTYEANLYDFKKYGSVIFVARCVDGEVTEVWDYRNSPRSSYTPPKKKTTSKKESDARDDPYDVYDYADPEDFYDDNYADFWEYEEAEEYWNEHWE